MSAKAARLRPQIQDAGTAPPTWDDARALMSQPVVIDADRLGLWAGDGEEDWLAPESVRRDPGLLLRWCEVNQPETILSDAAALNVARNREWAEVVGRVRAKDAKLRVTPAHVIALLRGDQHA